MKSDLHIARLVFLLVLLPAGLIYFAWQMSQFAAQEQAKAEAKAALPTAEEAAEIRRLRAIEAIQPQIAERRKLAQRCAELGMRSVDGLNADAAVLVILSGPACGIDCTSETIATELANSYYLEGLRVLLIRTSAEQPSQPPPGVYTVVMPACEPLVRDHGDDYYFRARTGEVSNSGDRHERLMILEAEMTALDEEDDIALPKLPFDPEKVVRAALNLPPR